jgi:GTP:adenosylcobinamide-phosphate guanylyltransferase
MGKIIISAGGKATRWRHRGPTTKHLVVAQGETLLGRLVRQLRERSDEEIFIRANDPAYHVEGTTLVGDCHDNKAFDMFCYDMLDDEVTFLYGDTFYSDTAIDTIMAQETPDILFMGTTESIVAISVGDVDTFKHHLERIKDYPPELIRGWALYQSLNGLAQGDHSPLSNYLLITDMVVNVNTEEDYAHLMNLIDPEDPRGGATSWAGESRP